MKNRQELALLAGALLCSLILAEVALRLHYESTYSGTLADLDQGERPAPGTQVYLGQILRISSSPRIVYQLMPDLEVRFQGADLRTNAQGWREEEIDRTKPPRTVRIAGLGDSVMFGWGVEEPKRYMDHLESELNSTRPDRRWQALNLAVPGYNLVMEVEAFKEYALDYAPDLIIIGFSSNDFCLPNFVIPRRSIWAPESFLKIYLERSQVAAPRLVQRLNVLLDSPQPREQLHGTDFFATYCSEENVSREQRALVGAESFSRSLADLARIARQRQIPLVLLHHGIGQGYLDLGAPDPNMPPDVSAALDDALRLDGLTVADLSADFRRLLEGGLDGASLVLSDADPHPSALGHELIAELLLERLVETGVVDRALARSARPAL